jgi:ABC-type spermidine/putrescine transport system permease subunit II
VRRVADPDDLAASLRPGHQWFTLSYLHGAFTGATAIAITNSLWVSAAAAVLGVAIGLPVAWLAGRTALPGRRFVAGGMWLVLLLPSWLPALGWQRLVQADGVMYRLGLDLPFVTHAIMGPFGVVLLLGLRSVPFSFLAVTAGLAGLGQEFEDAARVHGASRIGALRLILPMLALAIWSALAVGFAESISDFGVAATLAYNSNFSLATYQLYQAIDNFPPSFPAASAMGCLLVAAVAIPLALQARALRGRSYQMLSGRTRQAEPRRRPAGAHAGGDLLPGPRRRDHDHLHHPRPGRGVRPGRPRRRAAPRQAGAGRNAGGDLHEPGDPFVARFTGLSGELPVRLRPAGPGLVEIEPPGGNGARPFQVRAPSGPGAGLSALLMIRPTGVRLVSGPGDEHHLTGVVADVAFRGRGYEHAVDPSRVGPADRCVRADARGTGESVALRLEPGGCHVFMA